MQRRLRLLITMCLAALMIISLTVSALSAGGLDQTFGTGGKVTTDFFEGGLSGRDSASSLVLQPDGKLVAAGSTNGSGGGIYTALARYNPDGTLDTSFGAGGRVVTDFGPNGFSRIAALALQPDGKLVGAGTHGSGLALVRYNANGTLDTSFGTGGKVSTNQSGATEEIYALVLQPDGKLVAAGVRFEGNSALALWRYNANGTPDSTFGVGGRVTGPFGTGYALALQPDGKLIAAGGNFGLARYNANGTLDNSFGAGGMAAFNFGSSFSVANALALQPDGKIIAGGLFFNNVISQFALARYTPNGALDASFGTGGQVTTDLDNGGNDTLYALGLYPDGKIAAAGNSSGDFGLARYNTNGALDTTFGLGGKVTTDINNGTRDEARALVIQPDGKIVAAGGSGSSSSFGPLDFALAKVMRITLRANL